MRISRRGVHAIWAFLAERKLDSLSIVPWTDAQYDCVLSFSSLVKFREPFDEEFEGKAKYSSKVKLHAGRIITSVVRLSVDEAKNYVKPIIEEKRKELGVSVEYMGHRVVVKELLRRVLERTKEHC
jgi:hypothetical protein